MKLMVEMVRLHEPEVAAPHAGVLPANVREMIRKLRGILTAGQISDWVEAHPAIAAMTPEQRAQAAVEGLTILGEGTDIEVLSPDEAAQLVLRDVIDAA